eukprot:gene23890-biopygen11867
MPTTFRRWNRSGRGPDADRARGRTIKSKERCAGRTRAAPLLPGIQADTRPTRGLREADDDKRKGGGELHKTDARRRPQAAPACLRFAHVLAGTRLAEGGGAARARQKTPHRSAGCCWAAGAADLAAAAAWDLPRAPTWRGRAACAAARRAPPIPATAAPAPRTARHGYTTKALPSRVELSLGTYSFSPRTLPHLVEHTTFVLTAGRVAILLRCTPRGLSTGRSRK